MTPTLPARHIERGTNPVEEIRALLGNDVVLLPNRQDTKEPVVKRWQSHTLKDMARPNYLRSFIGRNIGVLLGKNSGGLCTIDIDTDSDVDPFLEANPRMRNTLRTKRVRGCNIWMRIEGEYPATKKITISGRAFGEWRADRSQTIIHGLATDTRKGETEPTRYTFLNKTSPIQIRFDEIQWPEGSNAPTPPHTLRLHSAFCNSATLQLCNSATLQLCISA